MAGENGQALLKVVVQSEMESLSLKLTDEQGRIRISRTWNLPKNGQTYRVEWTAPNGQSRWNARLDGVFANGTQFSNFEFDIVTLPKLEMSIIKEGLDLESGQLQIQANQNLSKAEIQWFDEDGLQTHHAVHDLKGQSGRIRIPLGQNAQAKIQRIELKIFDTVQRWRSFRLVSWYVEIPHEDVIFATNSAKLTPKEAMKIDAVTARIRQEVQKFRHALGSTSAQFDRLKLFIVGCTDTVGSAKENLRLSRSRARTIANYFKQKNIGAAIFYEGFGESLLAVPTADNVPDEKNRRALYILTNTQPSGLSRPGLRWQRP